MFTLHLLSLFVLQSFATLDIFTKRNGSNFESLASLPMLNEYAWNPNFVITNATLVNIFQDRSLFDYCDLAQYTPEGVSKILGTYNLDINSTWCGYVKQFDIISICQPETDLEKYILYWEVILGSYIQKTGAQGYAYSYDTFSYNIYPHVNFLGVDKKAATVFNEQMNPTFFGSQVIVDSETEVLLDQMMARGETIIVNGYADVNPLDINFLPFSFFRILSFLMVGISSLAILQSFDTYIKYARFKKRCFSLNYGTISIIASFCGNLLRVLVFLSPLSTFGIFDIFMARFFYTLSGDFSVISTLTVLFNWQETMNLISMSLNYKMAKKGVWRERRQIGLALFSFVTAILDIYVDMRAIYGDLGSATSLSTGLIFVVYEIFLIGFILLSISRITSLVTKVQPFDPSRIPIKSTMNISATKGGGTNIDEKVVSDRIYFLEEIGFKPKSNNKVDNIGNCSPEQSLSPNTDSNNIKLIDTKKDSKSITVRQAIPTSLVINIKENLIRTTNGISSKLLKTRIYMAITANLLVIDLIVALGLGFFTLEERNAPCMVFFMLAAQIANQIISILEMEVIKIAIASST